MLTENTMIPLYSQEEFLNAKSRDKLSLKCNFCNNSFNRQKNRIQFSIKKYGIEYAKLFCSNKCSCSYKTRMHTDDIECKNCNKVVNKRLSVIKKSKNHFCSRTCSSRRHNSVNPRIKKIVYCIYCNKNKVSSWSKTKRCRDCYTQFRFHEYRKKKIKDVLFKNGYSGIKFIPIRENAKKTMKFYSIKKICKNCLYDVHVECCHIKPICNFSLEQTLNEVNALNNLVYLCRNCHWEQENGLIIL